MGNNNLRKEYKENFLKQLKNISPNITIKGEYINSLTKIKCECEHGHIFYRDPSHLLRGQGCPICSHKLIIPEINSLWAERPDLRIYIAEDSIEFTKHTTQKSEKHINIKCPDCGFTQKIRTDHFTNGHFSCPVCSDNISYPNKMLRVFLIKLKEEAKIENLVFEKYERINGRRSWYDASFSYQGKNYFCEIDGGYHRRQTNRGVLEDTQKRDKEKDEYAKNKGIKLIRIPIVISDFKEFKEQILKSELSQIFNLNSFDWRDCVEEYIKIKFKGRDKAIAETIALNSGKYTIAEYAYIFKMSAPSVKNIFKKGVELQWCQEEDLSKEDFSGISFIAINLKTKEEIYCRNITAFILKIDNLRENYKKIKDKNKQKIFQGKIRNYIKNNKNFENFQFKIILRDEYLDYCLQTVIFSESYKEIEKFYKKEGETNG